MTSSYFHQLWLQRKQVDTDIELNPMWEAMERERLTKQLERPAPKKRKRDSENELKKVKMDTKRLSITPLKAKDDYQPPKTPAMKLDQVRVWTKG